MQVLHGGHAMLAADVVDGPGDKRYEVVQVHHIDALPPQEPLHLEPHRQRVGRGGQKRRMLQAAGRLEVAIVAAQQNNVVTTRRKDTLLDTYTGIDTATVAHEVVDDEDSHRAGARRRTRRAGTPATTVMGSTSSVTTEPAATTDPEPIDTPARTMQPAPSQQSSPITIVSRATP